MSKKIAVLMGGFNSESEVSRATGKAVYHALIEMQYDAVQVEFDQNVVEKLKEINPYVIFNALHGQFGEDGRIQGLLDILNIPYTHSSVITSALCMDKVLTREVCKETGVKIPEFYLLKKSQTPQEQQEIVEKIGKPFVIKPIDEGSSVGIEIILEDAEFDISKYKWQYGEKIIIEKYIKGKELQIAIMGSKALGVMEIIPKGLFFDYKAKYVDGFAEHIMPAQIGEEKYQETMTLAEKCHLAVGCQGISRVEMLLNEKDNELYLLEINTQPGFTPISIVPEIAAYKGISFNDIVKFLIENASCGPKYKCKR